MKIPDFVKDVIEKMDKAGYETYIVGGCVRDLLMNKEPKDWDLTTIARPEELLKVFPDGKYENTFGTVILPLKNKEGETENVLEITTYRSEHGYNDHRRPDDVKFEDDVEKDLERRDFTANSLAMNLKGEIIDLFGGEKDIKKKIIRAVGEPTDRFKEDSLRMMRAIRFSAQLGFEIEPKTERAIVKMAGSLKFIANERIRDEFIKILESDRAYDGVMNLYKTKLLQYIIPEILQGVGEAQKGHHTHTIFEHLVLALKHCPNKQWQVRLAGLLHDIGKPKTKKFIDGVATFYNHEYAGARMTEKIMKRLKFSNTDRERVVNLVRNHMFYYNVDEVTASSVRRLIRKVGKENLKDLMDLRIADRLGSGVPKAKPYKLRHLEYMIDKVQNDPVSVKMLKINGDEVMELLNIKPGPKVGTILDILLGEVIEDPKLNTKKYLEKRSHELNEMDASDLRARAKEQIEERREDDDKKIRKKHWVK